MTTVHPKTLKHLRVEKRYSQHSLADKARVDRKTIARLEAGKGKPRAHTVQQLARALDVRPERLAQGHEQPDIGDDVWMGRPRIARFYFDGSTTLAYDLVKDRYGVDPHFLIEAAPLLFTLLAEMSLTDRCRRADAAEAALEDWRSMVPDHLESRGWVGAWMERESAAERDLFCNMEGHVEVRPEYFEEGGNVFCDFLKRLADDLEPGTDAINSEDIDAYDHESLPSAKIFKTFVNAVAGGSCRASYALSLGFARLTQIPKDLRHNDGEDDTTKSERVKWLEAKVPDDIWTEHETLSSASRKETEQ